MKAQHEGALPPPCIVRTQGNRLSCRDQEGRRGSEEAVPGPSVFPSGEPGVSGDFWAPETPPSSRAEGLLFLHGLESNPGSSLQTDPLLLLPPIPPSIRVFSNELILRMRWAKYWSFSFSISPSNEYSGLISFKID